jgi:hypothetical protein
MHADERRFFPAGTGLAFASDSSEKNVSITDSVAHFEWIRSKDFSLFDLAFPNDIEHQPSLRSAR